MQALFSEEKNEIKCVQIIYLVQQIKWSNMENSHDAWFLFILYHWHKITTNYQNFKFPVVL